MIPNEEIKKQLNSQHNNDYEGDTSLYVNLRYTYYIDEFGMIWEKLSSHNELLFRAYFDCDEKINMTDVATKLAEYLIARDF